MSRGITLLEILFAILLMAILLALGISSFGVYQRSIQLQSARDELRSALHQARQRAIASADNQSWGLKLRSHGFVSFGGTHYTEGQNQSKDFTFSGVRVENYLTAFSDGLTSTSTIIFSKQSGSAQRWGTVILSPVSDQSSTSSVTVLPSGAIE